MKYIYFISNGSDVKFTKRLNYLIDGFILNKYGPEGLYLDSSDNDEYCIDLSKYKNQHTAVNRMLDKLKIKDREYFIDNLIK